MRKSVRIPLLEQKRLRENEIKKSKHWSAKSIPDPDLRFIDAPVTKNGICFWDYFTVDEIPGKGLGVICIKDIPDFIAISMFRIFQASLTNIMLHSKARSIKVKLSKKDEMLQLSVKDDGIGISKKQLESKSAYGIMGMRERANQINGIFEIRTKLNEGTAITVIVPLR